MFYIVCLKLPIFYLFLVNVERGLNPLSLYTIVITNFYHLILMNEIRNYVYEILKIKKLTDDFKGEKHELNKEQR